MADKDTKEEATTPEPEYNAAEALKALEAEETEESKAVTADEDKTEDKTEDTEEEEESERDDNDGGEDLPSLSDTLLKAIGDNAEAKEAWERHWKGVQKRDKQLAEREEALKANEDGYKTFQNVEAVLYGSTLEQAEKALEAIAESVRRHHGKKDEPESKDDGTFEYDGKTFYSQTELDLYQEIQELKAKSATVEDPEIEEIKAERRQAKEQAALDSWVNSNHKSLIAKVAAKTGGWGVTKEQIAAVAKTDKKALDSDPVKALKREYPDEYAKFVASGARKFEIKDMIDNSEAKGFKIPENPEDYTAAHALMEIGG